MHVDFVVALHDEVTEVLAVSAVEVVFESLYQAVSNEDRGRNLSSYLSPSPEQHDYGPDSDH